MIQHHLDFDLYGHTIGNRRGRRPATPEEIKMWWTIVDLLAAASKGAGTPVEMNGHVASEPELWSCSKCGGGMIAEPNTNRRSFYHACVPREVLPTPGNNPA